MQKKKGISLIVLVITIMIRHVNWLKGIKLGKYPCIKNTYKELKLICV